VKKEAVIFLAIFAVLFGSCKKEDEGTVPPSEKRYLKKVINSRPSKPTYITNYVYYDDRKIKSMINKREDTDSLRSIRYYYNNDKLAYKVVWEENSGDTDTISYEYGDNTCTLYLNKKGVKHKIYFYKLNQDGLPVYEEDYDEFTGDLYSKNEYYWENGNMMKSVTTYAGSNQTSTTVFTYFDDLYNPFAGTYSFSYGLSKNYISTVDAPDSGYDYKANVLTKENSYPVEVEFGPSTIRYEYY